MTDILLHNNESILLEWLDKSSGYFKPDFWSGEFSNRDILNMPEDDRPPEWFNPWTLSQELLDDMRSEFKGGSLKWQRFVEESLPNLNPQEERRLKKKADKDRKLHNCGKRMVKFTANGMVYWLPWYCNNYEECPKCRERREQQHYDRLRKLDGCQFVVNQRKEATAKYERTYSYKLLDGTDITVIESDEKIEGAQEMNYKTAREHQHIQVSGTRVSGKAGKEEKSKQVEENEETRSVLLVSHILDCDRETEIKIQKAYYERTKDFQPKTIDEAAELLKQCQAIWFEEAKKLCDKIHIVNHYKIVITQFDLDWSKRRPPKEMKRNGPDWD